MYRGNFHEADGNSVFSDSQKKEGLQSNSHLLQQSQQLLHLSAMVTRNSDLLNNLTEANALEFNFRLLFLLDYFRTRTLRVIFNWRCLRAEYGVLEQ